MRRIILNIACSLDGYIAREDGSIDWLPTDKGDFGIFVQYSNVISVANNTIYGIIEKTNFALASGISVVHSIVNSITKNNISNIQAISNTVDNSWSNMYMPSTNCGVNGTGVGAGYRNDSITMMRFFEIFDDPFIVHP